MRTMGRHVMRRARHGTIALLATFLLVGAAPAARAACAGDCNGDRMVTIDELITMVDAALGTLDASVCPAGDLDGNGAISIAEIVTAINRALTGCTDEPAPTATPTVPPCAAAQLTPCASSCPGDAGCCFNGSPTPQIACFDPGIQCTPSASATCPAGWYGYTACGNQHLYEDACQRPVTATPTPPGGTTATATTPPTETPVLRTPTDTPAGNPTGTASATATGTPSETATAMPPGTASATATGAVVPSAPTATETDTPTVTATPPATGTPPTPLPTIACPAGNLFTFVNSYPYPVWLAEFYQGSGSLADNIILPPSGDWELAANGAVALCMPVGWSGRFWGRTECHFAEFFANDAGYAACTSTSDCATSPAHVCVGGRCMLDCTSGGTPFCQGATGLNNTNAVCNELETPQSTPTPQIIHFCSYPNNTVCRTGDCLGLVQCNGEWDGNKAEYGPASPVSLFEPTSNSTTDVNYDVSLVSGYNVRIAAAPSSSSCYAPSCTTDLNTTCPPLLQLTAEPNATPGPVPCGDGTFCQSGACVGSTCVIGCNDPSDQCSLATPPAGLDCTDTVPGDTATYAEMYSAKGSTGDTMISPNQGNAICWGSLDCLPAETCNTALIENFSSGVGICVPNSGPLQPQTNCSTIADVGNPCGGYSASFADAIGYTCVSLTAAQGGTPVACVPAFNPAVAGVGTLATSTDGTQSFYSGTAGPMNTTWLTAAKTAGGGTPWYETFSTACPHQYGWQYDDHTGGFDCNTNGGDNVNFTITFGP
jgi:hypothetical protein